MNNRIIHSEGQIGVDASGLDQEWQDAISNNIDVHIGKITSQDTAIIVNIDHEGEE